MKKILCVVPVLLLFTVIGAPNARADSYTPTFACETGPLNCFGPPAAPSASFPGPTDLTVTFAYPMNPSIPTFTINLSASDGPTDVYWWSYGSNQYPIEGMFVGNFQITDLTTNITNNMGLSSATGLPYSDDISQGPLTFAPATSAAPEPTPVILMLLGVGLIFFMRRRFAMRVPRTA